MPVNFQQALQQIREMFDEMVDAQREHLPSYLH